MSESISDEQLMQDYAHGDVRAFEQLYARHRRPLFAFVTRGLADRALAEECFQDVWSRIVQARLRYRPEARFTTWMYQIAHNLVVDGYRRQRPSCDIDSVDEAELGVAVADPQQALSEFEQRRRLQLAVEALPPDQRLALQLRLEQELPLEDIAQICGVGRETIKSRLRYALDKLRERLGGHG